MPLEPGLRAEISHSVTEDDTASALGSGDVPVLATPRVLAWLEGATVAAVADHLEPGQTTVGISVSLEHLAASPVGAEVVARAELETVDGRRLTFHVQAVSGTDVIAAGHVERAAVDRHRFVSKLS